MWSTRWPPLSPRLSTSAKRRLSVILVRPSFPLSDVMSLHVKANKVDLPTLYIDEKAGSDTEGNGSQLSPFATPLAAYQSVSPSAVSDPSPSLVANYMVRKPDSVERNEWIELSASAKKKLVKNIDLWRKKEAKLAKEGERLAKDREAAEERDRQRREEAKNIVLVDDSSKGEAKKVGPIYSAIDGRGLS